MQAKSDNIMSLQKMVSPYKQKKDSGLLSIKVEGQEHLVKIYFELGMVVGLSMGTLKNEACLDILSQCKPVTATFLKGYKKPEFVAADNAMDNRLEELFAAYPVTGGTTVPGTDAQTVIVKADHMRKLENDFINIMGPIGRMVIDAAYSEIGYSQGTDMPSLLYTRLIDRLQEELPSEHRPTFAAKYAIGLAIESHDI